MSLYQRNRIWWYRFRFNNAVVRESTHTANKTKAERIERKRRSDLEDSGGALKKRRALKLFSAAATEHKNPDWTESTVRIESYNLKHLLPHFGRMLLTDIDVESINAYREARQRAGAKRKTIHLELGTLRAILRKHRLWAELQPDIKLKAGTSKIGRCLADDEIHRLLVACKHSRPRSLFPAVVLSLATAVRNGELRNLHWRNIDLLKGELIVGKSKTDGGEGRGIPLTEEAKVVLTQWRSNFPDVLPSHYVFPSERYGLDGEAGHKAGTVKAYDIDPTSPIEPWKASWDSARKEAGIECRWHDLRHTSLTRISENQNSDSTIQAIAGHLSKKMQEHYSHVRMEAKRVAIQANENLAGITGAVQNTEGAQKWAQ